MEHILTDDAYSGYFDETTKAQLILFHQLASGAASGRAYTPSEFAHLSGIEENMIQIVFTLYGMTAGAGETPDSLTLPDFFGFLAGNSAIMGSLPAETAAQLKQINTLVQTAASGQTFTAKELSSALGMEEELVGQVFVLYFGSRAENKTMSLQQLTSYLITQAGEGGSLSSYFDESTLEQLRLLQTIMNASVKGTTYTYTSLAKLLGMEENLMKMVFTYSDASANAETWKLSPQAAVNFLASHQKELSSALGNGNLSMLETAQKLINGSVAGTRYSPETLAPLFGNGAFPAHTAFPAISKQARKYGKLENFRPGVFSPLQQRRF